MCPLNPGAFSETFLLVSRMALLTGGNCFIELVFDYGGNNLLFTCSFPMSLRIQQEAISVKAVMLNIRTQPGKFSIK